MLEGDTGFQRLLPCLVGEMSTLLIGSEPKDPTPKPESQSFQPQAVKQKQLAQTSWVGASGLGPTFKL